MECVQFSGNYTANVHEALASIRGIIENLIANRDAHKDGFPSVIRQAMVTKLGGDAEETLKEACKNGAPRSVALEAVTLAKEKR
jgi:hypothetical protein